MFQIIMCCIAVDCSEMSWTQVVLKFIIYLISNFFSLIKVTQFDKTKNDAKFFCSFMSK